jgi:hypothetical protein
MKELQNRAQLPNAPAGSVDRPAITLGKATYKTPRLTVFGQVSKLTQGGAGTGTDGGTAGMNMVCL